MDSYDDVPVKKGFTLWKLLKWLVILGVISLYLLLTLRACALEWMKDTSKTKNIIWNNIAFEAYNSDPDNFLIYAYSTKADTSNDGALTVTNVKYIPSIGEIQLTVRYNNSLARRIQEEFSLDSEPEGEFLTFALRDEFDNLYIEYLYITDSAFVYNYRRLIFDGVDLTESTKLNLEAYYIGYVDFDSVSAPVNKLKILDSDLDLTQYKLKTSDLPGKEITQDLQKSRVWVKIDENR